MIEVAGMRYKADLTAGALKVAESRIIAGLLLRDVDDEGWHEFRNDDGDIPLRMLPLQVRHRLLG